MAQTRRSHLDGNPGPLLLFFHDARHAPGGNALAAVIQKNRGLAFARKLPALALLLAVITQRLHGDLTDRNDPLFSSLADHANDAELKISVDPVEAHQLAHANAGRIENLQHGTVADIETVCDLDRA